MKVTKCILFLDVIFTYLLTVSCKENRAISADNISIDFLKEDFVSSNFPDTPNVPPTDDQYNNLINSEVFEGQGAEKSISMEKLFDTFMERISRSASKSREARAIKQIIYVESSSIEDDTPEGKTRCKKLIANYRNCKNVLQNCYKGLKNCKYNYRLQKKSYKKISKEHKKCKEKRNKCQEEKENCKAEVRECEKHFQNVEKYYKNCETNFISCQAEAEICRNDNKACMQSLDELKVIQNGLETKLETCKNENGYMACNKVKCETHLDDANNCLEQCGKSRKSCDDKLDSCRAIISQLDLSLQTVKANKDCCMTGLTECSTNKEECIGKLERCTCENSEIKASLCSCDKSSALCVAKLDCCKENEAQCKDLLKHCKEEKDKCSVRETSCLKSLSKCFDTCAKKKCCEELLSCNKNFEVCETAKKEYYNNIVDCQGKLQVLRNNKEKNTKICKTYYPDTIPKSSFVKIGGTLYYWAGSGNNRNYADAEAECKLRGSLLVKNDLQLVTQILENFRDQENKVTGSRVWVDDDYFTLEEKGLCMSVDFKAMGQITFDPQNCKTNTNVFCVVPPVCNSYLRV